MQFNAEFVYFVISGVGGRRGLLETEKPRRKSPKTAKPQDFSSKTEIKALTDKALAGLRHPNLSFFDLYVTTCLLSEVLSECSLVSAELLVIKESAY